MNKIVILAAGLGTRLRRADDGAQLDDRQQAVADTGVKALIPFDRPFLDYTLTNVADAGYTHVCLVIGPEHQELREYYSPLSGGRLVFDFAVQTNRLGTAHAMLSAAEFAGKDPVAMINSDNLYPVSALRSLRQLDGPGLVGFSRDGLVRDGTIPAERLASFAVIEADDAGHLTRIIEKPDPRQMQSLPDRCLMSMNCWRFGPSVFSACRNIGKSPRGEYEIVDAVTYSMRQLGDRYRVVSSNEGVLDLSCRSDVTRIADRFDTMEVRL